ncbi:MAG: hypothetical protein GX631_08170, partial [Dehalococcoidales bacterium]|nr:hypothetical protein [Dehalococcoidales bacterium]
MKLRTTMLLILSTATLIITAAITLFSAGGMNDIKGVTSEASSGELLSLTGDNLKNLATGIRDSLDAQMANQYEMVKTWTIAPAVQEAARSAREQTMESLFEMWSAEGTREYTDGEAVGDGNPENDLLPAASEYLTELVAGTSFSEIFLTDARGYVIAASSVTGDFDQGPDDWALLLKNGVPVFTRNNPESGGESWYKNTNLSSEGFLVEEVEWDDSALTWGIAIVTQVRDLDTNEYLGQIKALFDYGTFIEGFLDAEGKGVYEIKVANQDGIIVASSFEDTSKVNNE